MFKFLNEMLLNFTMVIYLIKSRFFMAKEEKDHNYGVRVDKMVKSEMNTVLCKRNLYDLSVI